MRKKIRRMILPTLCTLATLFICSKQTCAAPGIDYPVIEPPKVIIISEEPEEIVPSTIEYEECAEDDEEILSEEDIELIALVTMAEAEGEPEEGKRLVIDTILNRVDSKGEGFPDTVYDVVYQSGQFTSMHNGRVDRCYVQEEIYNLVKEELECRSNYDVMYFTAGSYGKYGRRMFPVGNHYFASL